MLYKENITIDAIREFLLCKSIAIFLYDSLKSTNTTAKEMALCGAKHGTVIIANEQTGGRGRHGKIFFSFPNCGVYMSVILHAKQLGISNIALSTIIAAVVVCRAIEAVSYKKASIKWINDIMIENKKVCGILVETSCQCKVGEIDWLVVGVGINVVPCALPEEIEKRAGFIFDKMVYGARDRIAAEIINGMLACKKSNTDSLLTEYRNRLNMLGNKVKIVECGETYEGTAKAVDNMGRLIVKKRGGGIKILSSSEASVQMF